MCDGIFNQTADIDISLLWEDTNFTIKGTLDIPQAKIHPRDLSSSVTESRDVVFVDEQAKREKQAAKYHTLTDLTIKLGDKVHFTAWDIDTDVRGQVHIAHKPNQETMASGQLNFIKGKYYLFGHTMEVIKGQMLFNNGPISNPSINIQAQRTIHNINDKALGNATSLVTGAKITGNFKSPNLDLYSNPPLNDADILAYMLLGKRHDNTTAAEGQLLFEAATRAIQLFNNDDDIHKNITRRLGLDDLGFESLSSDDSEDLDNLAIGMGKQFTKRLYLHYTYGLVDSISKLHLRYLLGSHWTIEMDSSAEGSGADILYSIEK